MKRRLIWSGAEESRVMDKWRQVAEKKWMDEWWKMTPEGEGLGIELVISLVGKAEAKKLNRKWRKRYYIPQVLAFPGLGEPWEDGWRRPGDIVICVDKLHEESRKYRKNIDDVMTEWVFHGWKNLIGQGE